MSVNLSLPSACRIGCLEITLFSYLCNSCGFFFVFCFKEKRTVNFWNTLGITCQSSKPFVTSQPPFERVSLVSVSPPFVRCSCFCWQSLSFVLQPQLFVSASCWPPYDLFGKQSQLQEDRLSEHHTDLKYSAKFPVTQEACLYIRNPVGNLYTLGDLSLIPLRLAISTVLQALCAKIR